MHIATRQETINGQSVTVKVLPPGIAAGGWTPGLMIKNGVAFNEPEPSFRDHGKMALSAINAIRAKDIRERYPQILKLHKEGISRAEIRLRLKVGKDTIRRAIEWGKENTRWEK